MSHEFPVFACPIDCGLVYGGELSEREALSLIGEGSWLSTSRNWWYQSLVGLLCDAYPDFDELHYMTEVVALVPRERLLVKIQAIHDLIRAIDKNTQPFVDKTSWYGASVKEVRQNIKEAKVLRQLDDDSMYAFSNFFSFLVSHAAALEEAKMNGMCLLYVQPQP